eukprot:COSAG06_NODE_294_length_18179_cov_25.675830_5_plen_86_part_00
MLPSSSVRIPQDRRRCNNRSVIGVWTHSGLEALVAEGGDECWESSGGWGGDRGNSGRIEFACGESRPPPVLALLTRDLSVRPLLI